MGRVKMKSKRTNERTTRKITLMCEISARLFFLRSSLRREQRKKSVRQLIIQQTTTTTDIVQSLGLTGSYPYAQGGARPGGCPSKSSKLFLQLSTIATTEYRMAASSDKPTFIPWMLKMVQL